MSHHYIVTAQKPTAVTSCITGNHRFNQAIRSLNIAQLEVKFPIFHIQSSATKAAFQ